MSVLDSEERETPARGDVEALPAFGVWAPALTPLDAALSPDAARCTAHVQGLLAGGCHGVVVFGTTGEAPSFSADERIALLEAVIDAGVPAARLIVGTGCPALTDTVRLTKHAVEAGCAGALVVPPYYFKEPSEDGVFASYAEVIERTGAERLRLFLYHFPRLSAVPITAGLVERLLAAYPGTVAGVKDSGGDWRNTQMLLARFPELAIFPGSESFLLDGLEAGGAGCITATANVNAGAIRSTFDAWRAGDAEAVAAQGRISALRALVERQPLVAALKCLLAHYRGDRAWLRLRPPLVPLGEAAGAALIAALDEAGFSPGGGGGAGR